MKERNLGVVIGRFSLPTEIGHGGLLKEVSQQTTNQLILIGSANRRISNKNPFSAKQREMMLCAMMNDLDLEPGNAWFSPLADHLYMESRWKANVHQLVTKQAQQLGVKDENIILFGHEKDSTSYYLKSFPQWEVRDVGSMGDIDATMLRDDWFRNKQVVDDCSFLLDNVTPSVSNYLRLRPHDSDAQADWEYYRNEAIKFENYPFPDTLTFVCADIVVECAGHILLVTRKNAPGRNCLALPGGFKNRNETFVQAAIRELFEETNLRISERTIWTSIRSSHIFDHPSRSNGIPRMTYATHVKITANPDGSLPRAVGGDDAQIDGCRWMPTGDILDGSTILYDDHADIVDYFVR